MKYTAKLKSYDIKEGSDDGEVGNEFVFEIADQQGNVVGDIKMEAIASFDGEKIGDMNIYTSDTFGGDDDDVNPITEAFVDQIDNLFCNEELSELTDKGDSLSFEFELNT